MRILTVSAIFPPDVIGGAELCAFDLASWLGRRGHESVVLTTASSADERRGELVDGLRVYRVAMPRLYPTAKYLQAPGWQKPIWHLQDHLDPRNRRRVADVLDEVRPDLVFIHLLPGIGFNALLELAARDIPVVYFLHDMGLACIRGAMFRDGKSCSHRCALCALTSTYKASLLRRIPRLGFCSPSRAVLERVLKFVPHVTTRPSTVILNASVYPRPTCERRRSEALRLVYAGRLHASKGVSVLLEAAARAQETSGSRRPFNLTIVGSGPEEEALRAKYQASPWCTFTGFVSQTEVANLMVNSDLLCAPSVVFDNSPGVVVQALGLGLPVLASEVGGIPELVESGRTGRLVKPGDTSAWQHALEEIVADPTQLEQWRANALHNAHRFDQDHLGNQVLAFADRVSTGGAVA